MKNIFKCEKCSNEKFHAIPIIVNGTPKNKLLGICDNCDETYLMTIEGEFEIKNE